MWRMTPHACPVCFGQGTGYNPSAADKADVDKCHACNGTGIVWTPPTVVTTPMFEYYVHAS